MIEQKQIVKKPKNNLVKIIIKHIIIVQDILYHNILVKKEKLKVIIYGKKAGDSATKAGKANEEYYKAKYKRKNAINEQYRKIQSKSSLGDKILFNDATRKRAAKYIVDNNMTMSEARKKANKDAIRNTAISLGIIGGLSVAEIARRRLMK